MVRARRLALFAVLWGLMLAPRSLAAQQRAPNVAWVPLTEARVVLWTEAGEARVLREVDASDAIRLAASEVLLAPVNPGDRVRVEGDAIVGLATGVDTLPDAITWWPHGTGSRELRIPSWSRARFIAVRTRTSQASEVRLSVARGISDPQAWYRTDEQVRDFLWRNVAVKDHETPVEARRILRLIRALRAISPTGEAANRWLMARYLAEAMRERPLVGPYFSKHAFEWSGGSSTTGQAFGADVEMRTLKAGERLMLQSDGDVFRIAIQAPALGVTRLRVLEGEILTRVLEFQPESRTSSRERWLPLQTLRSVVAPGSKVTVEVIQGSVRVAAEAFAQSSDILDIFQGRRVLEKDLLRARRTSSSDPELIDALAALDHNRELRGLARLRALASRRRSRNTLALLKFETARRDPLNISALQQALTALKTLPPLERIPLERALFEKLSEVDAVLPETLATSLQENKVAIVPGSEPSAAISNDAAAIEALRAIVTVPYAEATLKLAGDLERAAARAVDSPEQVELARRVWRKALRYELLDAAPGTAERRVPRVPEDESRSDSLCQALGPAGLRWTVLSEPQTTIDVSAGLGTHARVQLRTFEGDDRELIVHVDGVPGTVHGIAGFPAQFAVLPGKRRFERPQGPALLARVPRTDLVPCRSLREFERWARLPQTAEFVLPSLDSDSTGRVVVDTSLAQTKSYALTITSGNERFEAWVRPPASGAIEFPVRSANSQLFVHSMSALAVRASVRTPIQPRAEVRFVQPELPELGGETEQVLLESLKQTTRELKATDDENTRKQLRRQRAELLDALGSKRLAEFERERVSDSDEPDKTEDELPEVPFVILPSSSDAVVPLGTLTKIPPLSSPRELSILQSARAKLRAGYPASEVTADLLSTAKTSSGADALLLANAAERAGLSALAGQVFERIAERTKSGAAFARAAALLADAAVEAGDTERAFRAFLLATRASELGELAQGTLARLAPAVSWTTATAANTSAGTALIEHVGARKQESLGMRIRRALVDAPDDALLLTDARRLELRLVRAQASELMLQMNCLALGLSQECSPIITLDGRITACSARPEADSGVAGCTLKIPAGEHRLEVKGPSDESVVSVRIRDDKQGDVLARKVVSSWSEIDEEHPYELRFAGPTVLRISARGLANRVTPLEISVRRANDLVHREHVQLSQSEDPEARRVRPGEQLREQGKPEFTESETLSIAVLSAGEHRLYVNSPITRALIRVEAAFASGLPRPRESASAPKQAAPGVRLLTEPLRLPPVGSDPEPGYLTIGATLSGEREDLSELDEARSVNFVQVRAYARREIVSRQAWGSLSALYRVRDGTDSHGAELHGSVAAHDYLPGGYLRARVMRQSFDGGAAVGFNGALGILWSLPLTPNLSVLPHLELSARQNGELPEDALQVDPNVFNRYALRHPTSLSAGLRALHRPFVDTRAGYGSTVRYSPAASAVDRADLLFTLDTLPGSGLAPWIEVRAGVSYRPAHVYRNLTYVRSTWGVGANFFQWVLGSGRLTSSVRATHFIDFPGVDSTLSFLVSIGYEETFGRGLTDYSPADVPFRARLEEGSNRVVRRSVAKEAAWQSD